MKNSGGKKIFRWYVDGKITEFGESLSDPKTELEEAIGFTAFEKHKEYLLAMLRRAQIGPRSRPLDADRAWRRLGSVAMIYLQSAWIKQRKIPVALRRDRLGKIAEALTQARRLIEEAEQDKVLGYLYSAWCEQNIRDYPKYEVEPDGSLVLVRLPEQFDDTLAALSGLEAAACNARDRSVPPKNRPKGSAMPKDLIYALAEIYEESVGTKLDKLTNEHFVEFVGVFSVAMRLKVDALEAIKYALKLERKKSVALGNNSPNFPD